MKLILTLTTALITALANPTVIVASSITLNISGNGSDSESKATHSQENKVEVEQSNKSDIKNDVSSESNTGENKVDKNTGGEVKVETGSSESHVEVKNENINQNKAEVGCGDCDKNSGEVKINISNNGDGSKNQAELNQSSSTQVEQNNTAKINTTVNISSNTGNNSAKNNTGGDVKVSTGNIYSNVNVSNQNVNNSNAKIGTGQAGKFSLNVSDNGAKSENMVVINRNNNTVHITNNQAYLNQEINEWFNTGGNTVSGNVGGRVFLSTGSIGSRVIIANNNINTNNTVIGCCKDGIGGPVDPDPEKPGTPGDDNDKPSNGNNGDDKGRDDRKSRAMADAIGGTNGEVLGAILPATGGASLAYLLANVATLLTGLFLKFRRWLAELLNTQFEVRVVIG